MARHRVFLATLAIGILLAIPAAALGIASTHAPGPAVVRLSKFSQLTPAQSPSGRDQLMMAYDPPLKKVIEFGGYDYSGFAYNDTWSFSAGKWVDLTPNLTVSPPARWAASLTFDPALGGLILFGGRSLSQFFNDTWLFNKTGWHNLSLTHSPSERSGMGLGWYAPAIELVLFGGGQGNLPAGSGSPWSYYNDTWLLTKTGWTNVTSAVGRSPQRLFDFQMVYDPSSHAVVGFGGYAGAPSTGPPRYVNDTWAFRSTGWTQLKIVHAPVPGTETGAMTWSSECKCLVYFGAGARAPVGNQTWTFGGGKWLNLTGTIITSRPAARANLGFADDAPAKFLVIFGGDAAPPVGIYEGDSWSLS